MKTPNINIIVIGPVVGSCGNYNNMIQCTTGKTHQNLELFEEKKCSEIIEVSG